MTLPNVILFPHAMLPLFIFEPRYRRMIEDVLESHRMFCVAMQKPGAMRESPVGIAGLGMVRACVKKKDGTSNLVLQGLRRDRPLERGDLLVRRHTAAQFDDRLRRRDVPHAH